jgi:NADH:ubiquinone oxidoreductase subunit 6 (subunit J)
VVPFALLSVAVIFAILSIRSKRLITSALWLAGVSALLSVVFYLFGAHLVAVVELSVGAGLVTVLFAFAISVAGDDAIDMQPVIRRPLSIGMVVLFVLVLGLYASQAISSSPSSPAVESSLGEVLWQERGLDMLVQVVLIFSGVLGLLGLLAEVKAPLEGSVAAEVSAHRDRDLRLMETQLQEPPESSK